MIKESDLLEAIAECQGERNPNANTCIKLAAFYTILEHLHKSDEKVAYSHSEPPQRAVYESDSDFSRAIRGLNPDEVYEIVDELMDTVQVLIPKLYYATIEKLKNK